MAILEKVLTILAIPIQYWNTNNPVPSVVLSQHSSCLNLQANTKCVNKLTSYTFCDDAMLNARGRNGPIMSIRYCTEMFLVVSGKSCRTSYTSTITHYSANSCTNSLVLLLVLLLLLLLLLPAVPTHSTSASDTITL